MTELLGPRFAIGGRIASPLHPSQALPRRLLLPVWSGVGADAPTAGADHTEPEGRHSDVIRRVIGAEHRLVVALPAGHRERPHAELCMLPSVVGAMSFSDGAVWS
jgi:hypothetical protein